MTIPTSLLTHVKTFDIAHIKEQQGPVSENLAKLAANLDNATAPNGPSASESLANYEPRSERISTQLLYDKAKVGDVNPMTFDSREEAVNFAQSTLEGFKSMLDAINTYGSGDVEPGGAYTPLIPEDNRLNDSLKLLEVMNADRVEASRLYLEIDSAILEETFGIEGPIFEINDGKLEIKAFDIEYNGEKIVRSTGDGGSAEYNGDGTLSVDKRV